MDSDRARVLFSQHAHAMAYIDVEKPDGVRSIGSAFHIGDGVFVTARHVVEGNRIVEIKITEPVGLTTADYFREVLKRDASEDEINEYDREFGQTSKYPSLFRHYLEPLNIVEGPYFSENPQLDVAAFRVEKLHHAAGVIKLGVHWDDWVPRGLWNLSDAIVLGYPPLPMSNAAVLIAARAEIHTFIVPRHVRYVHFILSAIPRGGFSGGVAIHEDGDALGVITSSFTQGDDPEHFGFLAVLSVEAIVDCLMRNKLYPEPQRQYHQSLLGLDPMKWIAPLFEDRK
jgi:Trypsin-like peptidase domain